MKKEELLQKYNSGKISLKEMEELEKRINDGSITLQELEDFTSLVSSIPENIEIKNLQKVNARFYTFLESATPKQNSRRSIFSLSILNLRWSLPILLIGLAFLLGRESKKVTVETKFEIIENTIASSLLNTEQVSDKINLVSSIQEIGEADSKIIGALLFTLNNDESSNVRIACIDVLAAYSYLPEVRTGLINAIISQSSSIVLITLSDAINLSGQKLEREDFTSKINKQLPPPLKNNIVKNLNNI